MSTPMDIYSTTLRVPFEIAAYCRMHKFSQQAADLTRAIKEHQQAKEAYDAACDHMEETSARLDQKIAAVRAKMEQENDA